MRVPWTARRSNQLFLKEISPGYSLEGLILKLKLQYFGHLMRRADSFEKTLMLGGIGGKRRRGRARRVQQDLKVPQVKLALKATKVIKVLMVRLRRFMRIFGILTENLLA